MSIYIHISYTKKNDLETNIMFGILQFSDKFQLFEIYAGLMMF